MKIKKHKRKNRKNNKAKSNGKKSGTVKTVMLTVLLLSIATTLYSQSSQYPYFMKHFWKETNENTRSLTNQFIQNTTLGEDYVIRYNKIYRDADNLFDIKKTLENKYDSYSGQVKRYEKQYNSARAALALAKTSYSFCRSNCNGILQNIRNITNNLNNLVDKMNTANSQMNSIHDRLDGVSSKLYALDRELREFAPRVRKYFNENMENGTISSGQ